jgi:hypothetical protein
VCKALSSKKKKREGKYSHDREKEDTTEMKCVLFLFFRIASSIGFI